MRVNPSHSLKLIAGGGFLGAILTTFDSTLGGGLKLFLPTFQIKIVLFAKKLDKNSSKSLNHQVGSHLLQVLST